MKSAGLAPSTGRHMPSKSAFVLSAGVRLKWDGDELSITNTGDIVIETPSPQPLGELISSDGDVVLTQQGGLKLRTIRAPQGRVTLSGKIEVESVIAKEIVFFSGKLKSSVLRADDSIALGGSRVEANVVVAPLVTIASSLKGRATSISSENDPGPHHLKGGFSLLEFVDLVPNGQELLLEHNILMPEWESEEDEEDDDVELESIDNLELVTEPAPPVPEPAESDDTAPTGDVEETDSDDKGGPEPVSPGAPPAPEDILSDEKEDVSASVQLEVDEEAGRSGSVSDLAADMLRGDAASTSPQWAASAATIRGALEEITASYEGEPPPPVGELAALAQDGDLKELKDRINGIWSSLLKYHQRTKAYIPNTVTHMFQQIQMELRKL